MTVLHRNRAIRNLERIRDFEGASVRVRLEALRAVEHAAAVMAAILAQKLAVALERPVAGHAERAAGGERTRW